MTHRTPAEAADVWQKWSRISLTALGICLANEDMIIKKGGNQFRTNVWLSRPYGEMERRRFDEAELSGSLSLHEPDLENNWDRDTIWEPSLLLLIGNGQRQMPFSFGAFPLIVVSTVVHACNLYPCLLSGRTNIFFNVNNLDRNDFSSDNNC